MKKTVLSLLTLTAMLALSATRLLAHREGHEAEPPPPPAAPEHGHEHSTKVPETVAAIIEAITKQQTLLAKTVDDKKLGDAHDHAFAIRDLAKSLVAKVPEAKKADVEQAASRIATIAGDIDQSAAAGAQKTTESNVKAMSQTLKILQTIVSHSH
jgi:hypothetical protein